jgi:5-methylcytosine-specific restriction endonuclease McrA
MKVTKQEIEDAFAKRKTMTSAARVLGISFSTFKRHATKLGVYTPNQASKGILRTDLSQVLVAGSSISSSRLKEKLLIGGLLKHECRICGLKDWQEKPITLELDHINGVNNDNRLPNLRLLCPNCHSQTPTFRGRNKSRFQSRTYTDDMLKSAVIDSDSISAVCRKLNLVPKGANISSVRTRMIEIGLAIARPHVQTGKA